MASQSSRTLPGDMELRPPSDETIRWKLSIMIALFRWEIGFPVTCQTKGIIGIPGSNDTVAGAERLRIQETEAAEMLLREEFVCSAKCQHFRRKGTSTDALELMREEDQDSRRARDIRGRGQDTVNSLAPDYLKILIYWATCLSRGPRYKTSAPKLWVTRNEIGFLAPVRSLSQSFERTLYSKPLCGGGDIKKSNVMAKFLRFAVRTWMKCDRQKMPDSSEFPDYGLLTVLEACISTFVHPFLRFHVQYDELPEAFD
ncbi:hypothetical protein SISNIDRAFT_466944 [Sistotremastrum niveocremeum HHB9708]|uniref:Uncharacterized protein n=1 Tax=Sistotremastrum niveocremeum HHB9708 TaxID=1314777 RepID=A0A164TSP0_9AGAM|nr:hypothetical protein SISNIDRAFT_466944 [Sistotremastrum niveocremeum HHB9708]